MGQFWAFRIGTKIGPTQQETPTSTLYGGRVMKYEIFTEPLYIILLGLLKEQINPVRAKAFDDAEALGGETT
jgi:hypothetical protein